MDLKSARLPILDGWNPGAPKIATRETYKRRNENEVHDL